MLTMIAPVLGVQVGVQSPLSANTDLGVHQAVHSDDLKIAAQLYR
ncbi:protein of unknown function [Pseudomonas sp. JV551A1]|nr:protein of unknown function [Pseudomonas sp. JV551A1]